MSASLGASHHFNYDSATNLKWSATEKATARRAFDRAVQMELQAVIAATKRKAAGIQSPSELWDLELFLTERRNQIDRQFDYRDSVLIEVFASLMLQGKLAEQDLQGLHPDKVALIHRFVAS